MATGGRSGDAKWQADSDDSAPICTRLYYCPTSGGRPESTTLRSYGEGPPNRRLPNHEAVFGATSYLSRDIDGAGSAGNPDELAAGQCDIIYGITDPAELIRSTRERLGLNQRQLALRAGTTQAAVSRIERGVVSPTFATLHGLMVAMGEEPVLSARRLPTNWDPVHMENTLARTPEERLALAISWNRMAGRLASAGRAAREDG